MPHEVEWDAIGERVYQSGLDRGVLYLPDGSAVPWNGLVSVIEKFNRETSPVYFDGMKIGEGVVLGEFEASLRAITFPDEFLDLEGIESSRPGVYFGDQRPKMFGLCYRVQIGNDLETAPIGYKLHIIYNLTAVPSERMHASTSQDPALTEFEWALTAVPEEVPGFRPTAHIVIDTREIDPWLLEDIEAKLYGGLSGEARLIPMPELVTFMTEWARVRITDHGDGTWTATADRPGFITVFSDDSFIIENVNAVYTDEDTYIISNTADIIDIPLMKITNNHDGTWTAESAHPGLIVVEDDGYFVIHNSNTEHVTDDMYIISDLTATDN